MCTHVLCIFRYILYILGIKTNDLMGQQIHNSQLTGVDGKNHTKVHILEACAHTFTYE